MKGKIIGTISQIGETGEFGENGFKKREAIVKTVEEYPNTYLVEFTQDKVGLLDAFKVGQNVKISCSVRGREYEKDGKHSVFTSINAWEIEPLES